jgi:hypothetical protein
MEQNKIEDQIKEKLNNRTIQPSAASWNRLDAMLNITEKEKSKPNYKWLAVAAAVVVFLGLGILYTSTQTSSTQINDSIHVATVMEPKNDFVTATPIATIAVDKKPPILTQNESKKINTKTIISEEKSSQELESIQKIIAQEIATNSKTNPPTTYKYISPEALLNEIETGQKTINPNRNTVSKNKIKINAAALLSGVEKELDSVYRETTLDKLNKNYNRIKSVIANRNFE